MLFENFIEKLRSIFSRESVKKLIRKLTVAKQRGKILRFHRLLFEIDKNGLKSQKTLAEVSKFNQTDCLNKQIKIE